MTYDAVIIGSGLGGLVCGVILTKAGMKVCVLERSNQPGGCLQSYRRGGLPYETGLHYVGGLAEGEPLHDAFRYLGLDKLPWQQMDTLFDRILLKDKSYALGQGEERFVETLAEDFPDQREQLKIFYHRLQHSTIDDTKVNAWQYLHDTFQDEELIQVLSATALRVELRKESLPLFNLTHTLRSYVQSSWRLRGDGNMIIQALIRRIEDAGGMVRCHSEVTEITAEGKEVTGVVCADGTTVNARYVISDIHPAALCRMLAKLPGTKQSYVQRITRAENTYGMFTASLRVKPGRIPYLGHNAFVYDTDDVWSLVEANAPIRGIMISFRIPEENMAYAQQIDILTPVQWEEMAPWLQTTVGRRGETYKYYCREKTNECIRMAERYLPGLSTAVEKTYTSTPLTYRDYLDIPEGSAFGLRKDCRFPLQTYHSPRTHFHNLFLTGQNLALPGIEGVTKTAFITCNQILGSSFGIQP